MNRTWSGKRDSNPRPRAWKARALPTELFPPVTPFSTYQKDRSPHIIQAVWWRGEDSNLRRHRRQIYSLLPLTAREPLHVVIQFLRIFATRKPMARVELATY